MNKTLIGSLAAISLASTGVVAFTDSANAGTFRADLQISNSGANGISVLSFSKNTINFSNFVDSKLPDPQGVTLSGLLNDTVYFDNKATIRDINSIPGNGTPLVASFLSSPAHPFTFDLYNISNYTFADKGNKTVGVTVFFDGFFNKESKQFAGAGNLTFQVTGINAKDLEARLANGEVFGDKIPTKDVGIAFSGAAFTTTSVPEPATLMGLGVVGAALATSRRQKAVKS